jgi:nicotinamidase-related amidase
MDTALLLIDAQVNTFEPEPAYRAAELLTTLRELLARARAGAEVIFVRHNGRAGGPHEPLTPGWAIHPELAPRPDEPIIDKHRPDAFYQTELAAVLTERGIRRLVIAGLQTEYCIDTTTRRANSLDYEVILAADGHSTEDNELTAGQIIAHHNDVLRAFADVRPADGIDFTVEPSPRVDLDALTNADQAGIRRGLAEWPVYDAWLATGQGRPFWPHTHPNRVADTLRRLWEPSYRPRDHYLDPPRWETGLAHAFLHPLENIPAAFRKGNLQAVKAAIDHLLQNPRNPLSNMIRPLDDTLWLYESRDLRLFYVPHVTTDKDGQERRYIFLVWLAPGVPVVNPFA